VLVNEVIRLVRAFALSSYVTLSIADRASRELKDFEKYIRDLGSLVPVNFPLEVLWLRACLLLFSEYIFS